MEKIKMEKIKVERHSVEELLLRLLYPRKVAMDYWPGLFNNKKTKQVFDTFEFKLPRDADKISKLEAARLCIAEYNVVEAAKRYLKQHPKAVFVNLFAAFTTVFDQFDNGKCRAYNVDSKKVLIARKEAVGKGDREQGIIADIREDDFSWFDKIEWNKEDGIFFYAIDVFSFLKREEVKRIVANIADRFKDAVICFDCTSSSYLSKIISYKLPEEEVKQNGGFYFSLDDDNQITKWSFNLADVWRHPLYTYYFKDINKLGLFTAMAAKSADAKLDVQFVEIRVKR